MLEVMSGGAHILVVDDDESIRLLLARMIGRAGYEVQTVGTPGEALLAAMDAPPDAYVLDVRLPDMNGRDLCRALKSNERTRRPILMISAESSPLDAGRAFDAGCDAFLAKPFRRGDLVGRLGELVGHVKRRTVEFSPRPRG